MKKEERKNIKIMQNTRMLDVFASLIVWCGININLGLVLFKMI